MMTTQQFIEEHLHDDVRELALKYHSNAEVDMALALRQIEARQSLQKKVPSWSENDELLFPSHLSIEQCSSEATAGYKATLLQGSSLADLTGGLGVDCHMISKHFQKTDYVEIQPELCALAEHNFKVLGSEVSVHNCSASDYLERIDSVDCLFLDPSRRDQYGRKTVSISDCTPDVTALQDLLLQKAYTVMLKLSPMLDISTALRELHHLSEVHLVAVGNECREMLFILKRDFHGEPTFTCVNLQTEQKPITFTQETERNAALRLAKEVSAYLYEPNAALMKGGCFRTLSQRFGVDKLHPNSHLYTSDHLVKDFPGRIFNVLGTAPFGKTLKKTLLSEVSKASIATRNFPMSVAEIRKTLKIADGDEVFLFATTLVDGKKVIIKTTKATLLS